MKLLALDPSITACGWAVFEPGTEGTPIRLASGTFKPTVKLAAPSRFDQLAQHLADTIGTHVATHCVIEIPDGYQIRSFAQLAVYCRAVGICEGVSFIFGCEVTRATVNEWKGTTKKAYTALIVERDLRFSPADDNECDACGLGLWWFATRRYRAARDAQKPTVQRSLFAKRKGVA